MKICWDNNECYEAMLNGAKGLLWGKLEDSQHFKILEFLLNQTGGCLLDIGCGAGALSTTKIIKEKFNYVGLDSSDVIENVALKYNSVGAFIKCQINPTTDLTLIDHFDVVLMNAFIDVLQQPLEILDNVLKYCNKQVIIHRQSLTLQPTYITTHESYGGMTYQSHINVNDFYNTILKNFEIKIQCFSGLGVNDNHSFLLQRNKK